MREIKFISRHPKNSDRVYGEVANKWGFNEHGYYHHNGLPNQHYIQCQYTNMKDKNGVEIYEGDIVRLHIDVCTGTPWEEIFSLIGYSQGEVIIHKTLGTCLKNYFTYDTDAERVFSTKKKYKTLAASRSEVVGNIFFNPELLNPPTNG